MSANRRTTRAMAAAAAIPDPEQNAAVPPAAPPANAAAPPAASTCPICITEGSELVRPCDGPKSPELACTHAICVPCWQKIFDEGEHETCPFCRRDVGVWLFDNFKLYVAIAYARSHQVLSRMMDPRLQPSPSCTILTHQ